VHCNVIPFKVGCAGGVSSGGGSVIGEGVLFFKERVVRVGGLVGLNSEASALSFGEDCVCALALLLALMCEEANALGFAFVSLFS